MCVPAPRDVDGSGSVVKTPVRSGGLSTSEIVMALLDSVIVLIVGGLSSYRHTWHIGKRVEHDLFRK